MNVMLAVGSTALDTIETPTARREEILGGSVPFVALGGEFFTAVRVVSPLGTDFPAEYLRLLEGRGVDTRGMTVQNGLTFRWTGRYHENMNDRDTLETQLNVLGDFNPVLPDAYRNTRYIFLANGTPESQLRVLDQCDTPRLVVADTMNLWINTAREKLGEVMRRVDGLLINDSEAVLLTGDGNLVRGGRKILEMGPRFVVIKKGEHGAILFTDDHCISLPALPNANVVDPTGAGDSFGGAMLGYLASQNFAISDDSDDGRRFTDADIGQLRRAIGYGTVVAGCTIEGFSIDSLLAVTRADIDRRFEEYRRMLSL